MADKMSPDASPGAVARPGAGVRRVNNLPLWIAVAAVVVFLVVMVLVASDRAAKQHQPANQATEKGGDSSVFARQIAGTQTSGMVPATDLQPLQVPTDPGGLTPSVNLPAKAANVVPPPVRLQRSEHDEDMEKIRQARLQKMISGAQAKTNVPVTMEVGAPVQGVARGSGLGSAELDPGQAYQARLASLQGGSMGGGLDSGGRNSVSQFDNATGGDRWALPSRPEAPRTSYELRAGFVIPAILMSGINSDLPGQIMAQVSQNIYDTPTGNHILIPLGSRLVGTYASDVAFGQARVLIAWQRIVFPDGKAMDIGAMPGADGAGYAGFNDKVNNHYVRLFGSAVLLSAVTAGISYSQQSNQQQGTGYNSAPTAGSAMSEALGQQLGQVTGQLLAKNMNISPTLEIRPGYRFNVMVTKDLTFASPYQPFDYQRQVNRK